MLKWSYRKYFPRRWPNVSVFGGRSERYTQKDLYQSYLDKELDEIIDRRFINIDSIDNARPRKKAKTFYDEITSRRYMSDEDIFRFINAKYEVEEFKTTLTTFLN